ncbi:TetR/AcrR family transcriptional regulator C-terminal domain-containing protein [Clostridium felsineum]|uniref:TetR/AcrR family transcriptional regulator C-terminal domain-containing protein n=1 Tax=Clostridium felsineum TaxID=36839 RepID=UPI00214D8047|nr:TetR/AcrR family transcriptional regulator C-terminal domain-containing protein [Clostridium felsineum]MCR3761566.1 TetR/AcrR family transcriptional regulator C-terminal domain-containing protein [Clostridium felsineum]
MYHIKEDKRAKTSANMIYQGLSYCLKKKTFDKITITDIQQASTVGRATFYRGFDHLIDVLHWQCDCCFQDMTTIFFKNEVYKHKKEGLLLCFLDYWTEHSTILEQLLSINRVDIIYACHQKNSLTILDFFGKLQPLPNTSYEYFITIRSSIFIGILLVWIKHGKKETSSQLLHIISKQIDFIKDSYFYI